MEKRKSCWMWFPIRFTSYEVRKNVAGEMELVMEKGVLNKRIEKMKLFKITDISYRRGLGNFFCGVSNLTLFSTDVSSSQLRIVKIRKGRDFMNHLEKVVASERERLNVTYKETNLV